MFLLLKNNKLINAGEGRSLHWNNRNLLNKWLDTSYMGPKEYDSDELTCYFECSCVKCLGLNKESELYCLWVNV